MNGESEKNRTSLRQLSCGLKHLSKIGGAFELGSWGRSIHYIEHYESTVKCNPEGHLLSLLVILTLNLYDGGREAGLASEMCWTIYFMLLLEHFGCEELGARQQKNSDVVMSAIVFD